MEFLASYGLLAVAVLISFILTAAATPNPAKIPLRAFLPWTAVGLALFLVFWVPVGVLTCRLLFALLPRSWLSTPAAWSISLLVGLLLPQVGKLKDRFLTPGIARLVRPLTAVLQFIDEYTRLFLSTVINRKERKVSLEFFGSETANRRRALDRLYEDLNIEIARDLAQSGASPEVVFGVFKVRQQTIKFKYLMRYFGYTDCLKQLRFVAASPGVVFPSWPSDQGDRRTGTGEEDRPPVPPGGSSSPRRRKYEQPYVLSYVSGVATERVKKRYQVFVSSTYLDLKGERQQVQKALLAADCIPAGMEFFPCSDEDLLSLIRGVVDESDFYILLVGARYGSTTSTGVSYTEAEYEYASRSRKPILAFLHAKPHSVILDPATAESAEKLERLRAFRQRIQREHAPAYWNDVTDLPALVLQAIQRQKDAHPTGGWIRTSG